MDNIVSTKNISSTIDLYNINPKIFIGMLYEDALKLKIKLANSLLTEEYKKHYMIRDEKIIRQSSNAITFNEQLLKELKL